MLSLSLYTLICTTVYAAGAPKSVRGPDALDDALGAKAVKTCGTDGATLDERIAHCARPVEEGGFGEKATRKFEVPPAEGEDPIDEGDTPTTYEWKLVTRNSARAQVWLDVTTGLVWSDRSVDFMVQPFAYDYCVEPKLSGTVTGDLPLEFRLPEASDYELASAHGLFAVLPHMDDLRYWSASLLNVDLAWVYDSYFKTMDTQTRWTYFPVRCIAIKDSTRK